MVGYASFLSQLVPEIFAWMHAVNHYVAFCMRSTSQFH